MRRLLAPEVAPVQLPPAKSDLQLLLERQEASEARYHEHISSLIATLDKIVTARYDRPTVVESQPNVISSPLPHESLSDVLSYEDDADFIQKSQEALAQ